MIQPTTGGIRSDAAGDGHFGTRRGSRTHRGVDYVCYPGEPVIIPTFGKLVRLARPYGDDPRWLGVFLQNSTYSLWLFYVDPYFNLIGSYVHEGDVIGQAQAISRKYNAPDKPVMTDHVHLQIKKDGVLVDPETLM